MVLPPDILTYPVQHPSKHFSHLWNCLFNTLVGKMSVKTLKYCTHWSVVATAHVVLSPVRADVSETETFIKVGLTRKSSQWRLIYTSNVIFKEELKISL